MRKQLFAALRILLVMTLLVGVIYPLVVFGISQVAFKDKANGSIVKVDGKELGSLLIGQNFEGAQWFHSRPSAAGEGYDALSSGGSNLGPTNEDLIASVRDRADAYRKENGLDDDIIVPLDAVTASASGLDPHISKENALLQATRIAKVRNISKSNVINLINKNVVNDILSFGAPEYINVLKLNIALYDMAK